MRGPLLLVLLCVAPAVLWLSSVSLDERFRGSYASLTSIAVLLAVAGTTAFALNLVLGARLRVVDELFGGLERMYRVHRVNGQLAFMLLLGHVVLVLAGRWTISTDAALHLLGPGAGWTVFAGVLAFGALTAGLALTLFVRLGHEVFVYVQRTFGIAFLLASYHVFTTDGTAAQSTALSVYLAAMSTLGIAAFLYRSVLGNVLVRRRRYRVVEVNRLDESVTEIVMEPVGAPLAYRPGQFVFVSFRSLDLSAELHPFEISLQRQVFAIRAGEIANQFHPFSITSAPGEPTLRITVKAVGDYTRALRRLDAGAEAVVEGSYGSFTPESAPNRRQIWAAGGIGVTPFLSMARSLRPEDGGSVDFYYCVEHREEAHFLAELEAMARGRDDFRVTLVPRDPDGFLTGRRLAEEHADLRGADVLVCGPPGMIESLRAQLAAEGLPPERFHAEEFSFARVGRESAAPRRSDGRVLAALAAPSLAGAAFGIAVIVGTYLG